MWLATPTQLRYFRDCPSSDHNRRFDPAEWAITQTASRVAVEHPDSMFFPAVHLLTTSVSVMKTFRNLHVLVYHGNLVPRGEYGGRWAAPD